MAKLSVHAMLKAEVVKCVQIGAHPLDGRRAGERVLVEPPQPSADPCK
jgi:hypothetical protein